MASPPPLRTILEQLAGWRDDNGELLGSRRESTRRRIVNAATQLLTETGYSRTRVDDVASAAGVSRPTLYAYFAGKEQLLFAAMAEEMLSHLDGIAATFDPARPALDRLRAIAKDSIGYVDNLPLAARMARDREPEVLAILTEHELARSALGAMPELDKAVFYRAVLEEAFPGTFDDVEQGEIVSMLRALGHMAPTLVDRHASFGLSVDRLSEVVADLLIDGLRAQAAARRRAKKRASTDGKPRR